MEEKIKKIDGFDFVSYRRETYSEKEMLERARSFYEWLDKRRTVRDFSDKPIPKEVIDNLILSASTAPSGAHKQPWTFCVVADADLKSQIRVEAEKEEYESYNSRMPPEWLDDLRPLQTDWKKPFLEIAPYLIIVFKKTYDLTTKGEKKTNLWIASWIHSSMIIFNFQNINVTCPPS